MSSKVLIVLVLQNDVFADVSINGSPGTQKQDHQYAHGNFPREVATLNVGIVFAASTREGGC